MEQIIKDIIGFIKSFYEAVLAILDSIETKNNCEDTNYYPPARENVIE